MMYRLCIAAIWFCLFFLTGAPYASELSGSRRIENNQRISPATNVPRVTENAVEYSDGLVINEAPQTLGFDEISSLSPGLTVATSTRDYQGLGRMNRMVDWRGNKVVHFTWMQYSNYDYSANQVTDYRAWDPVNDVFFQTSGGCSIHSSAKYSAYPGLDVQTDGKVVICNHYGINKDYLDRSILWYSSSSGACSFPDTCTMPDWFFWPSVEYQVWNNDTVTHVIAQQFINVSPSEPQMLHYFRKLGGSTTCTWDYPPLIVDTVFESYSHTVTASRVSGKVALVWAAGLPSTPGDGESATRPLIGYNDIYYMLSSDMGSIWDTKTNITKSDSSEVGWRAYQDLSCLITSDNHLQVVWDAREYSPSPHPHGSFPHKYGSRLFHWSEEYPTRINIIKDANWDIPEGGCYGDAWNIMSLVKPQISECDGKLYTIFVQFNDIKRGIWDDCAQRNWSENDPNGTANGEVYLSVSSDEGNHWDPARNLSNSYMPHCDTIGTTRCDSDHWPSMSRFGMDSTGTHFTGVPIVDPSGDYSGDYFLDVFYVNDKMPGTRILGAGIWTMNPLKWFRIPCVEPAEYSQMTFTPSEISRPASTRPEIELDSIIRIDNPGTATLIINSATVTKISGISYDWLDVYDVPASIAPGGNAQMHLRLNKSGNVTSSPHLFDGIIQFSSNAFTSPDTFRIQLIIADSDQFPEWATIRTTSKRIILNNAGNLGRKGSQGDGGNNLDFFNDCDTTLNVVGVDDNARSYLYDASPFVLRLKGIDTVLNSYFYGADWLSSGGFLPLTSLTVDSSKADYQYAYTGNFVSVDSQINVECQYWAPQSPDSSDFIVQAMRVYNRSGSAINDLYIGYIMDWDVPSDSGVENGSGFDVSKKSMYCYGGEYAVDEIVNNDCVLADSRYGGFAYYGGCKKPYGGVSDSIKNFRAMWTSMSSGWYDSNGILPGRLYGKASTMTGYETWESTAPMMEDSLYQDLHITNVLGKFNLGSNDTLDFVSILATEYDGGSAGFKSTIDKAKKWISDRPQVITWRDYSPDRPLIIIAYSPINLKVTDPVEDSIGKDAGGNLFQSIFPADYYEEPPDYHDSIIIHNPLMGTYRIEVIAEDGAPPGATYSIGILIDGSVECIMVKNATVPTSGKTDSVTYVVEEGWHYLNGDADRSESINILDVGYIVSYLYKNGPAPDPQKAADADCNDAVNILDVGYLISYLYKGGSKPCEIE